MDKRPLVLMCIFFILGIFCARFFPGSADFVSFFAAILFFILLSVVFWNRGPFSNIFLYLSIALFAALIYLNSKTLPLNHISNFLEEQKIETDIVGFIKSPALTRKPYYGKIYSTYLFNAEAMKYRGEWRSVKGVCQIRIGTEKEYKYGDRLLVKGMIRRPASDTSRRSRRAGLPVLRSFSEGGNLPYGFSGDFNYRKYLENQNIFALINAKEDNVTILAHNYKSNPILKYAYLIRAKLKNQIIEKMPFESGAFLRAILLGDRSELPKKLNESFKNSGTMHILAISGLHVGIVAAAVLGALKLLRIKREFSYLFTMLFLILFAALALGRPSVIRAVVMACIFLTGMLLGRRVDPYNSLAAAAIFILFINPNDFFNVGFQLSFLAVFSILYLAPKFMKLVSHSVNFYVKKFIFMPLTISLAAWLGTAGLILYYFRIITPIAIVANLFIIPALSILLIGGLGFILLGRLPFIGPFLAIFNTHVSNIIFSLAEFFASLPFSHFSL